MPWKDDGLPWEGNQFFGDAGEKEFAITPGQIPAPNSAGEENVSSE